MKDKVILPAEFRLCATCSFWDGERKVDDEFKVVVVADGSMGECLVREQGVPGMLAVKFLHQCHWEPISASPLKQPEPHEEPASPSAE